jgi:hypothetical protein
VSKRQFVAAVVQPVERRVESPSVGGSIPSCGTSCWMRAREDKGNRLLSGGRHQLARAFESLRIRHLFTSLAQRDQSAGLRNRRSHVRIVHEVPTNKPCSTTACRSVRLSNPGSGPLEVRRDKAWQHVESEGPCSTSRPAPQGAGSIKQAHRAATAAHRLPKGRCYPGRERKAKNVSSPAGGESRWEQGSANRKRVVPSGLAQPARHRISERVVRAVRASQARAAHRSSGTWGGNTTRLAKIGRVAREVKGMRCVAFLWPKAMGTTGNAHRGRLHLFGETRRKDVPGAARKRRKPRRSKDRTEVAGSPQGRKRLIEVRTQGQHPSRPARSAVGRGSSSAA